MQCFMLALCSFLCSVMCTIVCLFVLFLFSHGVVSLFSIYVFDCPSGIFRPSFVGAVFLNWLIGIAIGCNLYI